MKTVHLKPKEERRILRGHPWVFSNELQKIPKDCSPGDIVDVLDSTGGFVGRGYINPHTLIAVRILARHQDEIDTAFFRRRITDAHTLRTMLGFGDSFRAVYTEGDGLPGLIVDKYEDTLVIQMSTAGIERMQEMIISALQDEYSPNAIVLRNDTTSRTIEGLAQERRVVLGEVSGPVSFKESGINYLADVLEGQKTGFFFDQRENRQALKDYVRGRRVLDCFCYIGAWSLSAALYGASEVIGIDSSDKAIGLAVQNANRNNLPAQFKTADVFDELRFLEKKDERFGCIVLDPPAFSKSRSKVREALKGYKEINLRAMRLLERNGVLVTCSCSHHIDQELFREMLIDAAHSAGKRAQLLEMRSQARDHPVLLAAKETQYLKCAILIVE
jgi:23S rRNA (cytosine1962-C5)-methyltransferase